MNYESFTREQIESALTALKLENAGHLKTISDLKKEVKSLKIQCASFEGASLMREPVARRQTIH